MKPKILLTSFQTWLPHQKYNSSDDILDKIQKLNYSSYASLYFLRHLPVNIELARQKVIAEIEYIQPNTIVCCGMAEKRNKLTIESNASRHKERLYTSIDLRELTKKLMVTEISHDAGKFVCEGLYYEILKYIQSQHRKAVCIFIHIPLLENFHSDLILRDFHFMFIWLRESFVNNTIAKWQIIDNS